MNKIKFVTAVHGNEPMPTLALASMGCDQVVANPKALSLRVRFTKKDMNASFGIGGKTYEEKQAKEVLKKIDKKSYVLDLHTFSTKSDPFVIIVDLKLRDFAATLGFRHVVYMKHNIKKGNALINYRKGVSIELGNHDDEKSFNRACELVKRVRENRLKKRTVKLYEVYDIIKKPGKYVNFKYHKDGFIPVLAGEKAYSFPGLKAREIKL